MSLVAYYGTSDEESGDESEENKSEIENRIPANKKLGSEQLEDTRFSDSDGDNDFQNKSTVLNLVGVDSLLKGLPAPKKTVPTDNFSVDDDLEDEVKPKAYQIANAPEPPPKKSRHPVKITIPAINYDSDEESEPKQKKQKLETKGNRGLTSILPPPIHSGTKESNRTLLPYIFSKKKQPVNSSTKDKVTNSASVKSLKDPAPQRKDAKKLLIGTYGSDSDGDDEDGTSNFFSLNTQDDIYKPALPSSVGKTTLNLPPPVKSVETNIESNFNPLRLSEKEKLAAAETISSPGRELSDVDTSHNIDKPVNFTPSIEDAPLSFKSSIKTNIYKTVNPYNSYPANEYRTETVGPAFLGQDQQMESYNSAEDNIVLQSDEEFLKLQGKNERGKEEIHFIDVNADDFISTADYQKALSEETEYRSSHKKKDGPTSQQKRKHHITYLAHQAKERELELKNAWSQGRLTKKQTQAKYGF